MKKQVLSLMMGAMLVLGTSAHAFKTEAVTNFGGDSNPTGRFYFPITKDMSLITGFESTIYTTGPQTSVTQALLGVKYDLPVLGTIDTYGVFNFQEFTDGQKANSTASVLQWIVISKGWMAKLTDKVSVGLYVPLVKFNTANSKEISILSEIKPQVGMTIDFLDM